MTASTATTQGLGAGVGTLLISGETVTAEQIDEVLAVLPWAVRWNLFFVGRGTLLVGMEWPQLMGGARIFCAHSHRLLQGPPPRSGVESGGLLNLGRMIGESRYFFSLPYRIKPEKPLLYQRKQVGIRLASDPERFEEGLRVACGIAGCNQGVTLFSASDGPSLLSSAREVSQDSVTYLQALSALGAVFVDAALSDDTKACDCWISV